MIKSETFRKISVILVLGLSCAVFFAVILPIQHSYPMGWDAGYYISRTKYFSAGIMDVDNSGILRVGYMILTSSINTVTGLSAVTIEQYLPYILLIVISLLGGSIVSRALNSSRYFGMVFITHLFSTTLIRLTQSLSANLLAVLFFYIFILLTLSSDESRHVKWVILKSLCLLAIAITHVETFLIVCAILIVYGFIQVIFRKFQKDALIDGLLIIIPIVSTVIVMILVSHEFLNIVSALFFHYSGINNQIATTASSVQSSAPAAFDLKSYQTFFNITTKDFFSVLIVASLAIIVSKKIAFRFRFLIIAWTLVLLICAYFPSINSLEISNRIQLLWPYSLIFSLSLITLVVYLRQQRYQILLIAGYLIIILFTGISYVQTLHTFLPVGAVNQVNTLNSQITTIEPKQQWDVLMLKNPNGESPYPHYYLWTDTIAAIVPAEISKNLCVFVGKYQEYVDAQENGTEMSYSINPITRQSCERNVSGNLIVINSMYQEWDSTTFTIPDDKTTQKYFGQDVLTQFH